MQPPKETTGEVHKARLAPAAPPRQAGLFGATVAKSGCALPWRTTVYTVTPVRYEWDPAKAAANLRGHQVNFSEAATVLSDPFALTREDPQAMGEQRFVSLGLSDTGTWKANRRQRMEYENGRP
jgi:Ribonuclease toxin, BrnT, of type II toxin-antitoxin system